MNRVVIENIVKEMEGIPSPFYPESQTIRFEYNDIELTCNISNEGLRIRKSNKKTGLDTLSIEPLSTNVILIK